MNYSTNQLLTIFVTHIKFCLVMRILASMFQKCYIFVTEKLQINFKSIALKIF